MQRSQARRTGLSYTQLYTALGYAPRRLPGSAEAASPLIGELEAEAITKVPAVRLVRAARLQRWRYDGRLAKQTVTYHT